VGDVGHAAQEIDSFWDTETSGQTESAGDGVGKITSEMQTLATFTDTATDGLDEPWDMAEIDVHDEEIWKIHDTNNYPRLGWMEDDARLSNALCSDAGYYSLEAEVDTNRDEGILYWVLSSSSTFPSGAQIKEGQDHEGSEAEDWGEKEVTQSGTHQVMAEGLSPSTEYYFYFVHSINGLDSNILSTGPCSTESLSEPGAPSGLEASPGEGEVYLSWEYPEDDGGSEITDYEVEYKLTESAEWEIFDTQVSTETYATVTDLINGSSYYFRVSAENEIGQGSPGDKIKATPRTVPGAPQNLQAAGTSPENIQLVWDEPLDDGGAAIEGYRVERRSPPGEGEWDTIVEDTQDAGGGFYDSALESDTGYEYRIAAINVAGYGDWSEPDDAVTEAPYAPGEVTGLVLSNVKEEPDVHLSWSAPLDDGGSEVTGYRIQRRLDVEEGRPFMTNIDTGSIETGYIDEGLEEYRAYKYRVAARNEVGTGEFGEWESIYVTPEVYEINISVSGKGSVIRRPDREAYQGEETVELEAVEDPDSEFNSWEGDVEYISAGEVSDSVITVTVPDEDIGLTANFDSLIELDMPENPESLNVGISSFTAVWDSVEEAQGYALEISTDSNFEPAVELSTPTPGYLFEELDSYTTYYWRVRAEADVFVDSEWAESRVTTLKPLLEKPAVLESYGVGESSFTAVWDSVEDAQWYDLEISTDSNFEPAVELSTPTPGYLFEELDYDTTYYWRVRAKAEGFVDSDWAASSVKTLLPRLDAPGGLKAEDITSDSFRAGWDEVEGAQEYFIELASDSGFEQVLFSFSAAQLNYSFYDLNYDTIYYWRVKSMGEGYRDSHWSDMEVKTLKKRLNEPPGLVNTGVSVSSFTACWDTVEKAGEYQLEISEGPGFEEAVEVSTDALCYTFEDLDAGSVYYWRVKAASEDYLDSHWAAFDVKTLLPRLDKPEGLIVEDITPEGFTFSWDEVSDAQYYKAGLYIDLEYSQPVYEDIELDEESYVFEGLESDSRYFLRVRASGEGYRDSLWSELSAQTEEPQEYELDSPDELVSYDIDHESFRTSWRDVSGAGEYDVAVAEDVEFKRIVRLSVEDVSEHRFILLKPETTYYWRVRARSGDSGYSRWESHYVETTKPKLESPGGLRSAEITSASFIAKWDAVEEAEEYVVEKSQEPGFEDPVKISGDSLSLLFDELSPDTKYYWRVKAVAEGYKDSDWSGFSLDTLQPKLDYPAGLENKEVFYSSFTACWGEVENAQEYSLELYGDSGFENDPVFKDISVSTDNYTFEGLEAGMRYYWRVRASGEGYRDSGWSQSSVETEEPAEYFLADPEGLLSEDIEDEAFRSVWDGVEGAERYVIALAVDEGFENIVQTVLTSSREHMFSGLNPDTTYYWRVRAETGSGIETSYSKWSDASVKTLKSPVDAPGGLKNTELEKESFRAGWDAVDNAAGYEIEVALDEDFKYPLGSVRGLSRTSQRFGVSLNPLEIYYWRVRALGGESYTDSQWSQIRVIKLEEPEGLQNDLVTYHSFHCSWDSVEEADRYEIELLDSFLDEIYSEITFESEYDFEGLEEETQYYWRVRALDEYGNYSRLSQDVSVETDEKPWWDSGPLPPAGVRVLEYSKEQISFSWQPSQKSVCGQDVSEEIGYYFVYEKDGDDWEEAAVIESGQELRYTGEEDYYAVKAAYNSYSEDARSGISAVVSLSEPDKLLFANEDWSFISKFSLKERDYLYAENNPYDKDLILNLTRSDEEEDEYEMSVVSADTAEEIEEVRFDEGMRVMIRDASIDGTVMSSSSRALFWHNGIEWVRAGGEEEGDYIAARFNRPGRFKIMDDDSDGVIAKAVPRIFSPDERDSRINRMRIYLNNPEGKKVKSAVYDINGRLIRDGLEEVSKEVLKWDGRDERGNIVRSGLYIYQVEVGGSLESGTAAVAR